MNRARFCCILLCLSVSLMYAQTGFETPSFPGPTTASLGKYGDIPVGHHTGVANISIPIYSLTEGSLQLPISMSYHSSGVRVDELASWVGLGWSLNAGGMISRTIQGSPDEGGNAAQGSPKESYTREGWYQNYGMHPGLVDPQCWTMPSHYYGTNSVRNCSEFYLDAADGFVDTQPDLFTFNFAGYSGKFLFDDTRKAHVMPKQDLVILPDYDASSESFNSWTIITPDGTKFFFGTDSDAIEHGYSALAGILPGNSNRSTTSWYLTRIESMNAEHWIEFDYDREKYSYTNRQSHTKQMDCANQSGTLANLSVIPTLTSIDGCRIKQITTSSGQTSIDFVTGPLREDLTEFGQAWTDNSESRSLQQIDITKGTHTQSFYLDLSYFQSPTSGSSSYTDHDSKRLKLNQIKEITATTPANPNFKYAFDYHTTVDMARRLSLARDYWGYHNGASQNTGLFPNGMLNPCTGNPITGLADRLPKEQFMKAWILTEIEYPTGGKTTLEYEPHHDGTNEIGGLRVRYIKQFPDDHPTTTPIVQEFIYDGPSLYGTYPTPNSFTKVPNLGGSPYLVDVDYILQAVPPTPMNQTQGYHIGYSTVTMNLDGNGKSVFKYYNTSPTNQPFSLLGYTTFPPIPVRSSTLGGKLFREEHYDESNNLINYTQYEYEEDLSKSLSLRVVSSLPATSGSGASNVPIFNNFTTQIARAKLIKKTSSIDGLITVEEYEYSEEHSVPTKTSITNSDNQVHATENRLFDHWLSSSCSGDISDCQTDFASDLIDLRNQYVQTYDPSQPVNNPLILGSDIIPFNNAYDQAVEDFWMCKDAEWQSVLTCREDELDNFVSPNSSLDALPEMIRKNLILPIEVVRSVDGVETTGDKLVYHNESFITPTLYQHLVISEYQRLVDGVWTPDVEVEFDHYGNLIQHQKPNSPSTSYLFGYENRFPMASITNAKKYEVAYTSFEYGVEEDPVTSDRIDGRWKFLQAGGWSNLDAKTGLNQFDLNSSRKMQTNVSTTGDYILSFWAKKTNPLDINQTHTLVMTESTADGWTYYEYKLSLTALQPLILEGEHPGFNFIDELRLYPADAQMTTICYDTALRTHTMTNANNHSAYYFYDVLGRLSTRKDQNRNISQQVEYHLK